MVANEKRFRPRNIPGILDETFDLYRNNFVLLVGIAACVFIPIGLLSYALAWTSIPTASNVPDARIFSDIFPVLLLAAVAHPIAQAAMTNAVSRRYLDEPVTIWSAYTTVLSRIGAVLWTMILLGCVYVVGFLVLAIFMVPMGLAAGSGAIIIFGLILLALWILLVLHCYARLSLSMPVVIIEGTSGLSALKRSWALTQGFSGHVIGVLLLILVVVFLISTLLEFATLIVPELIVQALSNTLLGPLTPLASVILYFDLRVRKEGFDLQYLARELQVTLPAPDSVTDNSPQTGMQSSHICSHCNNYIRDISEGVKCSYCGAVLHSACWKERGGCTTEGCVSAPPSNDTKP